MNNYLRTAGVLAVALCASNAQAYKFTVTNYTKSSHKIDIQLALGKRAPIGIVPAEDGKQAGKLEQNFTGWDIGMCLQSLIVDEKTPAILGVDSQQFNNIMKYKMDGEKLDLYLSSSGVYGQIMKDWLCGNFDFHIFQTSPVDFVIITINPSKNFRESTLLR